MYISYTAAFHSQLPFFFVYLFFLLWFYFPFYFVFFYFDFPLYNKHRRIRRTSRKTMPNAHFHFHFSHSPHIHEQTQFWAVFETYFWVSTHTARASSRSALVLCSAFCFALLLLCFCLCCCARSDRHPHAAEFHERLTLAATAMWILLSCRWQCRTVVDGQL